MPDSIAVTKKKQVFHVDNIVKIINPEVVIRVGYPLTKIQALDAAETEYSEKIHAFMRDVGAETDDDAFGGANSDPALYHDLVDALASHWLKRRNYGGKERKIYTEANDHLRHYGPWRVLSKRVVKTGTYNNGGMGQSDWYGEPDYTPPHLSNEQSHVLLTLESLDPETEPVIVEIEAANVELHFDPKISMREGND